MKNSMFRRICLIVIAALFTSVLLAPNDTALAGLTIPAQINKKFDPINIPTGEISILTITVFNPNTFQLKNVAWEDDMPNLSGPPVQKIIIANTPGVIIHDNGSTDTNCGGASVSVTPGDNKIIFSGGTVPAVSGTTYGQCVVTVNVTSFTSANMINNIPVGAIHSDEPEDPSGTLTTNTTAASATLQVTAVANPSLTKRFKDNTIFVGQTTILYVDITNNDSSATLTGVSLTDDLTYLTTSGLKLGNPVLAASLDTTKCGAAATVTGNPGDHSFSLSHASILPNDNASPPDGNNICELQVNVTGAQGAYVNTIPAGPGGPGSIQTDQGVTNQSDATANLNIQAFTMTKKFLPTSIISGDTSTLTITIDNVSNIPYNNVSLWDDLYPYAGNNLQFVDGTASFDKCGSMSASVTNTGAPSTVNNKVNFSSGAIASGDTCTITISVQALQGALPGTYTNTINPGQLSTTENATNDAKITASLGVTPALTISKTFKTNSIPLNTTTTLTITINNASSSPYTQADLLDDLSSPTDSYVSIASTPNESTTCADPNPLNPPTLTLGARSIELKNGYIPASSSCTIQVDVVGSTVGNNRTNTIPASTLITHEGGTNPAKATASITVTSITPSVTKTFSGSISAGGTDTLTITIHNPAGAPLLTSLGLKDDLSTTGTGLTFTALTSNTCGGTVSGYGPPATQVITLSGGTLAAGGASGSSCAIVVVVTMPLNTNSQTVTNTIKQTDFSNAQLIGDTGDTTRNLTVQSVDVQSKSFSPTGFQSGGTSILTITLVNNAASVLTVQSLTDDLSTTGSSNLTIAASPAPSTTCGNAAAFSYTATPGTQLFTVTGSAGNGITIPHGGTCTVSFPVTGTVAGTYQNSIPIGNLTTVEGPKSVTARRASVTIYPTGDGVTLTKNFGTNPVNSGVNTQMTLSITAPADTSLTNVEIKDTFPTSSVNPSYSMQVGSPTGYSVNSNCKNFTNPPAVGDTALDLKNGTIPAGTTCTIQVNVVGPISGSYANTINPGDITDNETRTITLPVSRTLTVNINPSSELTITKQFSPKIIVPNAKSTLTVYLHNPNNNQPLNITSVTDNLPGTATDGVVIPASFTSTAHTNCGSGASFTFLPSGPGPYTSIEMTGGSISGASGGVDGLCSFWVNVQGNYTSATLPKTYTNTINPANVIAQNPTTLETINSSSSASDTLTLENLAITLNKGFDPVFVPGGEISQLSIKLKNIYAVTLTGISFTDDMHDSVNNDNIYIANPPAFSTGTCGGTLTGTPGDHVFTFSGGTLAGNTTCTLTLNATINYNGTLTNTINASVITSDQGATNPQGTQASLTDLPGASITKYFTPNSVAGNSSTLTITIKTTGGNLSPTLTGMGFTDDLKNDTPPGLVLSSAAPTNTCGGTLTAVPGTTLIQLINGYLPANSTCSITVGVTGINAGSYQNCITAGALSDDQKVTNASPACDTLTLTPYSLGNRVWYDTNDNGILDSGEVGISGVTVELYRDNGSTPGVWDSSDTLVGSKTTDANGYYRFDNLGAGDYIVKIPHSNFSGTPLAGYFSSGTSLTGTTVSDTIAYDTNDIAFDSHDHGVSTFNGLAVNYVSSKVVTLGPGGNAPTGETDKPTPNPSGEAVDDQSNLTVDFGFYRLQLGNQIFADINGNGTYDCGLGLPDSPLPGATVELFASDNTTQINVGTDGILGTADDAPGGMTSTSGDCSSGGNYLFSGLPAGSYIVKVLPTGYPSTVDTADQADTNNPNVNTDNNDNGVGTGVGTVSSNVVTLTPGNVGAQSNNTITNSTGTTYNPTIDFGYVTSLGKKIISTSAASTTGSDVTIGEIITYEVDMSIPAGAILTNVTLVDTPDPGLAFVDCVSVTLPGGVTSSTYTSGPCNTKDGTTAGSNPLISNSGGNVAFDFGTVHNPAGSSEVIQVQYSMIVLDILANQNGATLTNHAVWTRSGVIDTISASPVKIVEPKLTVTKNATPTTVSTPSIVTYTIDIAHSSQSQAGAFDVVLNDHIPDGLTYDPTSLNVSGTATLTSSNFDTTTNTLQLKWNAFPLNDNAHVTFQAAYLGPGSDTNTATVQWMSLSIDPRIAPTALSDYNANSTVRYFNTGSGNGDSYDASSSATISPPGHRSNGSGPGLYIEPGTLPGTGFAPGKLTNIPSQPSSQAYADLGNLWLEIPRLKVKMPIVGIPLNKDGSWDLTWLGDQAGYLDGTAYPTHLGNSVLTAHVYMSNGQPGPFVDLGTLKWGDQVIVHLGGQKYTYHVLENKVVSPQDTSALKHEELPWLTLLTCKDYNASTNAYAHRVVVSAVLIKVEPDTSSSGK